MGLPVAVLPLHPTWCTNFVRVTPNLVFELSVRNTQPGVHRSHQSTCLKVTNCILPSFFVLPTWRHICNSQFHQPQCLLTCILLVCLFRTLHSHPLDTTLRLFQRFHLFLSIQLFKKSHLLSWILFLPHHSPNLAILILQSCPPLPLIATP